MQTTGVHVWFVAHPRQLREWKGQPPNLYDISGSAHFINKVKLGCSTLSPGAAQSEQWDVLPSAKSPHALQPTMLCCALWSLNLPPVPLCPQADNGIVVHRDRDPESMEQHKVRGRGSSCHADAHFRACYQSESCHPLWEPPNASQQSTLMRVLPCSPASRFQTHYLPVPRCKSWCARCATRRLAPSATACWSTSASTGGEPALLLLCCSSTGAVGALLHAVTAGHCFCTMPAAIWPLKPLAMTHPLPAYPVQVHRPRLPNWRPPHCRADRLCSPGAAAGQGRRGGSSRCRSSRSSGSTCSGATECSRAVCRCSRQCASSISGQCASSSSSSSQPSGCTAASRPRARSGGCNRAGARRHCGCHEWSCSVPLTNAARPAAAGTCTAGAGAAAAAVPTAAPRPD